MPDISKYSEMSKKKSFSSRKSSSSKTSLNTFGKTSFSLQSNANGDSNKIISKEASNFKTSRDASATLTSTEITKGKGKDGNSLLFNNSINSKSKTSSGVDINSKGGSQFAYNANNKESALKLSGESDTSVKNAFSNSNIEEKKNIGVIKEKGKTIMDMKKFESEKNLSGYNTNINSSGKTQIGILNSKKDSTVAVSSSKGLNMNRDIILNNTKNTLQDLIMVDKNGKKNVIKNEIVSDNKVNSQSNLLTKGNTNILNVTGEEGNDLKGSAEEGMKFDNDTTQDVIDDFSTDLNKG